MSLLTHNNTALIDWVDPINRLHPLNRDLSSWWMPVAGAMGGSVQVDLTGFNHATFTNLPRPGGLPRPGAQVALTYNGTDQYAEANDETPLRFGTGDFTLSMWYRSTTGANGNVAIASKGAWNGNNEWAFYVHGSNLKPTFSFESNFADLRDTTENIHADNLWHHSVIIRRGDAGEHWRNGTLNASHATLFNGVNLNDSSDFQIGVASNGFEWFWNGQIDAVQIWKGLAFTGDQVRWLRYEAMQGFPDMLRYVQRSRFFSVDVPEVTIINYGIPIFNSSVFNREYQRIFN